MTFDQIAQYVCTQVNRLDDFAVGVARGSVDRRHRQIYESFDWEAAKIITQVVLTAPPTAPVPFTGVDHTISVRYAGRFLDPVSQQFIFDTHPELINATGDPLYYSENYDPVAQSRTITLYPTPGVDEIGGVQGPGPGPGPNLPGRPPPVPPPRPPPRPPPPPPPAPSITIDILGKAPFNQSATQLLVPYSEQALIAFVTADMFEFIHQIGKAQAKLQEAQALLTAAQSHDTPPATRPRMGKVLTATGNSLAELTDSVCDVIGRWEPEIRISVQERLQRNYQTLWEMALWPESTIVARITATDNEQVILPYYFDRLISIRPDTSSNTFLNELQNRDLSIFFNIDPQIFERLGDPVYYSTLTPVAVSVLPPYNEPLGFYLQEVGGNGDLRRFPFPGISEQISVFIKGWSNGAELVETVDVTGNNTPFPGPTFRNAVSFFSQQSYDTPVTISKPVTLGTLNVFGANSNRSLLTLNPQERERKHMRIWMQPNQSTASPALPPTTLLALGKKRISPLLDDDDTCELRNVENALINGAAADMLDKLAPLDATTFSLVSQRSQMLKQKAMANIQMIMDAELKQATHNSIIAPYTEVPADFLYDH